jgi:hypothetical protein
MDLSAEQRKEQSVYNLKMGMANKPENIHFQT